VLGYIGHASEPIIQGWVEKFSSQKGVTLKPGFMARSVESPWLHASFDRVSEGDGKFTIWQFKTGSQYASEHWDEKVPLDVQAQLQTEIFVAGTDGEWVVVWIGGREFRMTWVPRDDEFIGSHLLPKTRTFWYDNVLAKVPPEPSSTNEAISLWPGDPEITVEGSEELFDLWSEYGRQQAIAVEANETVEGMKLELQKAMKDAVALTFEGRELFTWRPRKGSTGFDKDALKKDDPVLFQKYVKVGEPTRVFSRKTVKEVEENG
jgi:predicted phage-related endonuclease